MENENNIQEQSNNRQQRIKQAIIWSVSFAVALVMSIGILIWLQTDLATYSVVYFVITVISLAMVFVIWGDYLLGAGILPD